MIGRYGEGFFVAKATHSMEMSLEGTLDAFTPMMREQFVRAMQIELGLESNPFSIVSTRAGSVIVTVAAVHDNADEAKALLDKVHQALKDGRFAKHGFRSSNSTIPLPPTSASPTTADAASPLEAKLTKFYVKHAPEKVHAHMPNCAHPCTYTCTYTCMHRCMTGTNGTESCAAVRGDGSPSRRRSIPFFLPLS